MKGRVKKDFTEWFDKNLDPKDHEKHEILDGIRAKGGNYTEAKLNRCITRRWV